MKKIIAIFLALSMLFAFSACGEEKVDETTTPSTSESDTHVDSAADVENETEIVSEIVTNEEGKTEIITEIIEKEETSEEKTTKKNDSSEEKTTKKTAQTSKDPSKWSVEEVVAFYKKACEKSTGVTSKQTMTMRKDSLKADGGLGEFLSFAEGLFRAVLKLSSTKFDGITGGFWDLTASDCKTAKAYKSGNYIVVEMTMKDQTDGIYGETYEGTVGHAISVVGGVGMVAEKFSDFDVNYKDADIKIHYTDAKLSVKINSSGVIENGTWSYIVTPVVNDLYIEGIEVDNAGAVIDYKVVVGGGF